jgi:thiol-disulfide isomerase/thioredoxin
VAYVWVAIAVVGALCVFDLFLSFGVIRRLREQTEALERLGGLGGGSDATVRVGDRVGDFVARTTAGEAVHRDHPDAVRLVGFFSPGCAPCAERIPQFLAYGGRAGMPLVAVVVVDRGDTAAQAEGASYVTRLDGAAQVVMEGTGGAVATAFGVTSFPALCLIDPQGIVVASGNTIGELPDLVTA